MNTLLGYDSLPKDQTKTCVVCKKEKHIDEFYTHFGYKDKKDRKCARCHKDGKINMKRLRKISPPAPSNCDCCGIPFEKSKSIHTANHAILDHCHDTDEFRGWLCQNCNVGIGKLGDNIEGLRRAIKYLERTSLDE